MNDCYWFVCSLHYTSCHYFRARPFHLQRRCAVKQPTVSHRQQPHVSRVHYTCGWHHFILGLIRWSGGEVTSAGLSKHQHGQVLREDTH